LRIEALKDAEIGLGEIAACGGKAEVIALEIEAWSHF